MPKYDKVLIIGDFNIHVYSPTKSSVKDFLDILQSSSKPFHITDQIFFFKFLIFFLQATCLAILMFLNLTAAFDIIDNSVLIAHLEHCVGIK